MKIIVSSKVSNYLTVIDDKNKLQDKVIIDPIKKPIGFSCLEKYDDNIFIGSSDTPYIYSVNISLKNNVEKIFIGTPVNKIRIYKDMALLLCSDINALLVYDIKNSSLIFEIPVGNFPFSMDINDNNKQIFITNFLEDNIYILDGRDYKFIDKITKINKPTDIMCHKDKIFVLEGAFDNSKESKLDIIDASIDYKNSLIKKMHTRRGPISMAKNNDRIFILNLLDKSINIYDMKQDIMIDKIIKRVGEMPSKIALYNEYIYVLDYYYGFVRKINTLSGEIKNIAKVKEPSAMLII